MPAGHCPHWGRAPVPCKDAPALAPVPAAQSVEQILTPTVAEYLPAGQDWQPRLLGLTEYLPTGQLPHWGRAPVPCENAPAFAPVPAAQSAEQTLTPENSTEYLPAAQSKVP